ncbi:uncharacterized protein LOC110447519 isoform X1 [Mizuhopecten yessoensis]|uniref:Uncharacterized protein n=1 Tax=Mizuhopecten yessoensis TaxID=6573 RepID=A0A210QVF3_MIZYE|nr:uncharacterized protein LOC110447519 isoform X1 [Mizuhopecten yessoensis]OWF52642.1 hypothetical protein KP79_PYT05841 [Mizuhopecten yessoensis]
MAECAFHQEARRRQANLDRQQEARKRFIARQSQNMSGALDPNLSGGNDAIMFSGADNFDTKRPVLEMFRVNKEGFNNRYRNRENMAPHVDRAYPVIYPGKDNCDYTNDINRNNRKMNAMQERYDITRRVNGDFHVQVLSETPP